MTNYIMYLTMLQNLKEIRPAVTEEFLSQNLPTVSMNKRRSKSNNSHKVDQNIMVVRQSPYDQLINVTQYLRTLQNLNKIRQKVTEKLCAPILPTVLFETKQRCGMINYIMQLTILKNGTESVKWLKRSCVHKLNVQKQNGQSQITSKT